MIAEQQLARVFGPDWQRMSYGQLGARAHGLEEAASFARTLAAFMDETDAATAGEALDRCRRLPFTAAPNRRNGVSRSRTAARAESL